MSGLAPKFLPIPRELFKNAESAGFEVRTFISKRGAKIEYHCYNPETGQSYWTVEQEQRNA